MFTLRSLLLSTLLPALLITGALAAVLVAQDAATDTALPHDAPLAAGEVARVNGAAVPLPAFEQYVGATESRSELGQAIIRQAHDAWVVRVSAARANVVATPERVNSVVAQLEERAGSSLEAFRDNPEFEAHLTLLTQQVLLMQTQGVDDPLDPAAQSAWLESQRAQHPLVPHPLSDDLAVSWPGGELTRAELGATLLAQLPVEDRGELLSEFLGVLVLHAHAKKLGVELSTEAAAAELAEREALVAHNVSTAGLTYEQIIEQTQGLSLEELVASPRFSAEVLLREMVDLSWDDEQLEALFERERALFVERYGEDVDFAGARHGVLQEVRRRSYQNLMAESKIVRRY
ncbi:MAG: hypothetical protein DHS20C15_23250 [Planctomycetota bacterium]|nr:MAG: hypothetical protein DHS20C15_23250 [Planctomycetota bacterium]